MTGRVAHVDETTAVAASFAIAEDSPRMRARAHSHSRHQVLYASRGALTLFTAGGSWLLPPERAAFLPAGVAHRVHSDGPVSLRTLYLDPSLAGLPRALRVFEVPALGRELIAFAMRFGASKRLDRLGTTTFALIAELAGAWAETPCPFELPCGESEETLRATSVIRADLAADLTADDVARAAGVSVRSLHRKLVHETGLSFREYLVRARVLAAVVALSAPSARVGDVASRVGFESVGAFARAFRKVTGESPSQHRARVRRA